MIFFSINEIFHGNNRFYHDIFQYHFIFSWLVFKIEQLNSTSSSPMKGKKTKGNTENQYSL
jgi:hypothetical protein